MKFFIWSVFFLIVGFPSLGQAQGHSAYCKDVDSTAASQECIKKHLQSEQERLNEVYEKVKNSLDVEKRSELQELQNAWLTYRDAECMWEAARPEDPALKHVYELSCMARVTEDRADLLAIAYGDSTSINVQREFGDFPRWMNALVKDNPGIFWDYGTRTEGDLNCNGVSEHAMVGIKAGDETPHIYLAVIENPPVGKPASTLFKFPVIAEKDKEEGAEIKHSICSDIVKIEIIEDEDIAVDVKEDVQEEICSRSLVLTSKNCPLKTINWTGKIFDLEIEEADINKKETEKK